MPEISGLTRLPWILLSDDDSAEGVGGLLVVYKAAAALNVGDAVFISAAKTVNKSVTAANHNKRAGVVVGGQKFGRGVVQRKNDVGTQAAAANEDVYVCIAGICYVVAQAAITAGAPIKLDTTTAGRVLTAAVLTIASGVVAVTSNAANGDIINGEGESRILGHAIEAAAAVGDKIRALISTS